VTIVYSLAFTEDLFWTGMTRGHFNWLTSLPAVTAIKCTQIASEFVSFRPLVSALKICSRSNWWWWWCTMQARAVVLSALCTVDRHERIFVTVFDARRSTFAYEKSIW